MVDQPALDPTKRTFEILQREIEHLEKLVDRRFKNISNQFAERDAFLAKQLRTQQRAVISALQAAKELGDAKTDAAREAAQKTETHFTKQIDQITAIIHSMEKSVDTQIVDLKERIDRREGGVAQRLEDYNQAHTTASTGIQIAAVVVSILAIAVVILVALVSK